MTHFAKLVVGEYYEDIELSSSQDNCDATHALLSQATHSIDIYTHELDPKIYNQSNCIDAIKLFILNNPRAKTRILIRNTERVIQAGHRLISLARHLSGFISIRVIHENYRQRQDAFLIVDQRGILYLTEGDRYDGLCNFNDPGQAMELRHRFTEAWNQSIEIADFRQICI